MAGTLGPSPITADSGASEELLRFSGTEVLPEFDENAFVSKLVELIPTCPRSSGMTKEEGIKGVSPTPQSDSSELAECSSSRPTFGGARLPNGLQTFAEQFSIPHLTMFNATKLPSRKTRYATAWRGLQPNRALG